MLFQLYMATEFWVIVLTEEFKYDDCVMLLNFQLSADSLKEDTMIFLTRTKMKIVKRQYMKVYEGMVSKSFLPYCKIFVCSTEFLIDYVTRE